jgi:hypothetical protein
MVIMRRLQRWLGPMRGGNPDLNLGKAITLPHG